MSESDKSLVRRARGGAMRIKALTKLSTFAGNSAFARGCRKQYHKTTMNHEIILEASRATLAGTMSFPEVVSKLLAAGVEYYHVDYVGMRKTFYSGGGETVVTPITYDGLPPVAAEFSADSLRAAIVDSQRHGQHYRDFTRRAMEAGVQGYFAFLRGKRVIYWGRAGDQHTEWFPGAKPASKP